MNGKVRLSLWLALLFVACAQGASKIPRRPTLSKEQRALLLVSKASPSSAASSYSPKGQELESSSTKSTTKALIEVTKAIARSHSASEVLTLNLTNLLILIVLKAVIFGIGLFYFGGVSFKGGYSNHGHGHSSGGHGGYSRSLTEKSSSFMTENELVLMLTFLLGSSTNNYECMYRFACENPKDAKSYLKASKMIVKGAKFAKKYINYDQKYENVVYGLEEALQYKSSGGDCSAKYTCSDVPDL